MQKPVFCEELKKEFESISAAAKELDLDVSQIAKVCKKKLRTAGGYHFRYVGQQLDNKEKEVSINKNVTGKNNLYYKANVASNKQAMRVLTKSGFYLYTYFIQNDDGYVFTLRRTHVMNTTGLSKTSYYDAVRDLIQHGYLVDAGDGYEFHDEPYL